MGKDQKILFLLALPKQAKNSWIELVATFFAHNIFIHGMDVF